MRTQQDSLQLDRCSGNHRAASCRIAVGWVRRSGAKADVPTEYLTVVPRGRARPSARLAHPTEYRKIEQTASRSGAMKFGAMVVPRASDWRLVVELEQMGYDSAWLPDSQMIYSDIYAVMALAAAHTSRIRLGPGVAIASTRLAPVTAHS